MAYLSQILTGPAAAEVIEPRRTRRFRRRPRLSSTRAANFPASTKLDFLNAECHMKSLAPVGNGEP